MRGRTYVESDDYCYRCGCPLAWDNEDRLCPSCDNRITGLPPPAMELKRESGRLFRRALAHLNPISGEARAFAAQCREAAALLLMAAAAAAEEGN